MDAPTSNRPWEATSAASTASVNQIGQPQLPSINAMTAGVPASGQEQITSYALTSGPQERDSGNWSMPPSTRKFNLSCSSICFILLKFWVNVQYSPVVLWREVCCSFSTPAALLRSSSLMPLIQVLRATPSEPMAINICPCRRQPRRTVTVLPIPSIALRTP